QHLPPVGWQPDAIHDFDNLLLGPVQPDASPPPQYAPSEHQMLTTWPTDVHLEDSAPQRRIAVELPADVQMRTELGRRQRDLVPFSGRLEERLDDCGDLARGRQVDVLVAHVCHGAVSTARPTSRSSTRRATAVVSISSSNGTGDAPPDAIAA